MEMQSSEEIEKNYYKLAAIFFLLLFNFITITNLPIPYKYNIEAFFLLIILMIGGSLLLTNYFKKRQFATHDPTIHYLLICLFLVIEAAILAQLHFGQPLIYGLLAGRRATYCLSGLILFFLLNKRYISIDDLERIFIFSFFAMLIFYYLMNILVPPKYFIQTADPEAIKGYATYSAARGIYRYRFPGSLLAFGFIYTLLSRHKPLMLGYLLAVVIYFIFFSRGRILLFTAVIIFLFFLFFVSTLKFKIGFLVSCGMILSLFFILFDLSQFGIPHFINFFSDGINAIMGQYGSDASANSRIFQAKAAWQDIQQYHYLGVGKISRQWKYTPEMLFGYFYPSDIGLLGIWFIYGIAGIIAFFYLCIKMFKLFLTIERANTFIFTCWLYAVYILFTSLMTGAIFFTAFGQFSIMLAVLTFSISINKPTIQQDV